MSTETATTLCIINVKSVHFIYKIYKRFAHRDFVNVVFNIIHLWQPETNIHFVYL